MALENPAYLANQSTEGRYLANQSTEGRHTEFVDDWAEGGGGGEAGTQFKDQIGI